jgi:streptogramin lyase
MRRLLPLLLGSLLTMLWFGAAPSLAARGPAPLIKGARIFDLPEQIQSDAVAIGPGAAWFGLTTRSGIGASIAHIRSGRLSIQHLRAAAEYASTASLDFDADGNLWFTRYGEQGSAIMRRETNGTLSEFSVPGKPGPTSLVVGPDGDVWFTHFTYGGTSSIGWVTPAGSMTEIPLASGSDPSSAVIGPDGATWFTEGIDGVRQIGRVTTADEIELFPLGEGVEPHELAVGTDGALWFTENGEPGPHRRVLDRIGRMATNGEVTQFRIPFGNETEALAADPRGVLWFSTEEGEISSISTSGAVGSRGCATSHCGVFVNDIAVSPGGALWFSAGVKFCKGCGGGSDLIAEHEGTLVGKLPPGALSLAPTP